MAGILIDFARFVEVQQRRGRIAAELGQADQTAALETRRVFADAAVEHKEPAAAVAEVKMTRGTVDVR